MGPVQWFLFVYVLGGLTFVPLLIALAFLHAFYTLPAPKDDKDTSRSGAELSRPGDDKIAFKTGTDDLAEKFQRTHDSDVAAGYFAICREYIPGGVNGKPPDKLTPTGDLVAQESPSVYQSMYRSIFDRSQKPSIEPSKNGSGKTVKKVNNVFYVVLRHGHLMLYDDVQQLEVRYVISLEYHDVDLYAGGDEIPEGELFIKRNAIRLTRNKTQIGDKASSLPFFLFGQNLSEKEDFYHAILKNQEKILDDPPVAQPFDVNDIVLLVQKLHSSEEHLQTRWLNAMIGRLFLAMYKTPEMEGFIRDKLTKKISRVQKPTFITRLALRKIDLGTSAPFFTNPRLRDLTVNGDCTIEADVNYSGGFRIEIAATARIDLGTRFKAREVDMVLAVTAKKLQGHVMARAKPAPSNRFWFTFEKMPQLDLEIEPIVSSRQITYTFILKAIESRIREVVAESVVLPFWDDVPFFDTRHQRFRGGIWKKEPVSPTSIEIPTDEAEDSADAVGSGTQTPPEFSKDGRVMSMPVLAETKRPGKSSPVRKPTTSISDLLTTKAPGYGDKSEASTPRLMRSASFASAANPAVTTNHADANPTVQERDAEPASRRESVAAILKDLSARSVTGSASPSGSQTGSPPVESVMARAMAERFSVHDSKASDDEKEIDPVSSSLPRTPTTSSGISIQSTDTNEVAEGRPRSAHDEAKSTRGFTLGGRSLTAGDRKQALASVNAAAAAAQKWGWGVLARNRQRESQAAAERDTEGTTSTALREPMGRGRPLPPPGTPLPPPEKLKTTFLVPKRKPLPPPLLPKRQDMNAPHESKMGRPSPRPPLPDRRQRQSSQAEDEFEHEVLVVEAPPESAPTSPTPDEHQDEHQDDFFGHGESEPTAVEEEATSPPVPDRRSDTPPPVPEEEELNRREIGMYT